MPTTASALCPVGVVTGGEAPRLGEHVVIVKNFGECQRETWGILTVQVHIVCALEAG
jgi:hypothetical protein